jgi:hypothetical protein
LFWAEVSNWVFDTPSSDVFCSDLAGRNRRHVSINHFTLVSGLALDLVRRRVYIADQHRHTIESMNYEGKDVYTVVSSEVRLKNIKWS